MIEAPDVDAAKAVLIEWLNEWRNQCWVRMAQRSAPVNKAVDSGFLASHFSNRKITQHTDPEFKDGNMEVLADDDKVGFADFDVSVDLAEGCGSASFVARVVGVGDKWGVNAISTMKRTTSPPGKGQQCQRRSQKAKHSAA